VGDGHNDRIWPAAQPADHRGRDTPAGLRPYPARRSLSGCFTAAFVLAALAAATATGIIFLVRSVYSRVVHDVRSPGAVPSSPGWAARDVTVTCATGAASGPLAATVTVVNHGSDAADYLVAVGFSDGSGTGIGGGTALANDVPPGGSATSTATGIAALGNPAPFACTATDVIRTIARS